MKIASCIICVILVSSCMINSLSDEERIIILEDTRGGTPLTVEVEKGPQWVHKENIGPFGVYVYPQFAFWIEDDRGEFVRTFYVTGADGEYDDHSGKKKMGSEFFRECFPVWSSRAVSAGEKMPSPEAPFPDTVTSATPFSNYALKAKLPLEKRRYTLFCEVNKPGDGNEAYPADAEDWVGQPSLIYSAEIIPGRDPVQFRLAGRSDSGPQINPDVSEIGTALEIVKVITLKME